MTDILTSDIAATPQKRKADTLHSPAGKKTVACLPCHKKKIKCHGGTPCSNCTRSRVPEVCAYPERKQKLAFRESDAERLVSERVSQQRRNTEDYVPRSSVPVEAANVPPADETSLFSSGPSRNPLLNDGSWFEPFQAMRIPIHIGEASDAAFATQFRQVVTPSAQHIARCQYVSDSQISSLSDMECVWPPLSRARLLVKVALRANGSIYHIVRKSEVIAGLENYYQTQPVAGKYFSCKLLALFAIGEIYSTRTQSLSEDTFPGLNYFSRASRILRECNERPQIENVECTLLLAMYSLLLNRRHSAYQLASSAVRQAVIVGLQQGMPESLSPDREFREHCVRIWWTAYSLDRLTSLKVGYPVSIQDEDISVDLPSTEMEDEDFVDAASQLANIRLAKLSRKIISSLYSRKRMTVPFVKRVQDTLKDLQSWLDELPSQLKVSVGPATSTVVWLHLSFNQHVILATRPILLHMLRSQDSSSASTRDTTRDLLQVIADACLHATRHSYRLLTDAWIDGSFAVYDYTYTQCLFSVAVVLAISSVLTNSKDDYDNFIIACDWIQQLAQSGNFAAKEFLQHLSALQNETAAPVDQQGANRDSRSGTLTGPVMGSQLTTTEMALAEPLLQDFLLQTDFDTYSGTQLYDAELQSLYT